MMSALRDWFLTLPAYRCARRRFLNRTFVKKFKEANFYILLVLHGVWNGGIKFSVPLYMLLENFLTCEWRNERKFSHV